MNKYICQQYENIVDYITKICKDTSSLVEQINYIENLPFGPLLSLNVSICLSVQYFTKARVSIFEKSIYLLCSHRIEKSFFSIFSVQLHNYYKTIIVI